MNAAMFIKAAEEKEGWGKQWKKKKQTLKYSANISEQTTHEGIFLQMTTTC